MAKIYSLCLSTENKNNRENKILYRIADLNGEELVKYLSYNNMSVEDLDNNLKRNPRTYKDNHELNNLRIWEWDPLTPKNATKSSISYYELINNVRIASIGEEKIIDVLKMGIEIPQYKNKKSLLVIEEDKDNYKVIEVDSNKVMSRNGIAKINTNFIGYIEGFILSKDDFLDTSNVEVYSPKDERLPSKIIYKYLKLPFSDFKLDVLDVNDKLELFINKQIKLNQDLTRSQKREVKTLFNEMLKDYKTIENYLVELGLHETDLKDKVENVSSIINDILSDDNTWNKFSEAIIENIPNIKDKFIKLASDKFHKENKDIIEKLESTIKEKSLNVDIISKDIKNQKKVIDKLNKDKEKLDRALIDNTNLLESLDITLKDKINKIKGDMATFISDISLIEALGIGAPRENDSSFVINNLKSCDEDIDSILDINEFTSILSINLEIAGIDKDNIIQVSNYITSSLIQKNNLYLVGTNAYVIADAISATYCGMNAEIIYITSSSINIEDLINNINKCKSSVVVIENLVNINENIALLLSKMIRNKILLFTCVITESLNYLQGSLLNSLNIICLDYICERPMNEEYLYADATNVDFEKKYEKRTYRVAMEELDNSLKILRTSKLYKSVKSELISIIDGIGMNDGIYAFFLCEVIPILAIKQEMESIEEILNSIQLSDKNTSSLRKLIGLK